jgi:hypothetical protein
MNVVLSLEEFEGDWKKYELFAIVQIQLGKNHQSVV